MPFWGTPRKRGRIVVCVRKRPRNKKEISMGDMDVISIPAEDHIVLCEPRQRFDLTEYLEHTTFRFDRCFDENVTTAEVYFHTAAPMVSSIFHGYMATCFAYGQTGSGKTFTMGGPQSGSAKLPVVEGGIYGMVVRDLFALYDQTDYAREFTVSVNFFEIYCNKVYDLLNRKLPLRVMEDAFGSVQLLGLREYLVKDVQTTLSLLRHGYHLRTNGQTVVNEHSSRSHAIFQINIRRRLAKDMYNSPDNESRDNDRTPDTPLSDYYPISSRPCNYPNPRYSGPLVGRYSLVDLAGNERSMDRGTASRDRVRQLESGEINKSLLALKECIRALGNNSNSYLPFRTSKLTQVLRESFVGRRSCTCMIATVSPGLSCCEHSMNTFRYAQRVKHLVPSAFVTKLTRRTPLRIPCWLPELDRPSSFGNRAVLQNDGDTRVSNSRSHQIVNRRPLPKRNTAMTKIRRYSRPVSSRSSIDTNKRSQTPRSNSPLSLRLSEPSSSVRNSSARTINSPDSTETSHSSVEQVVTDVEILEHFVEPAQLSRRLEMESRKRPKCMAAPCCIRSKSFTAKAGSLMSSKKCRFLRVQKQKQDVIRKHEDFVKRLPQWIAEHRKLLNRANKDKANMFAYVKLLTSRLNQDIDQLKKIQDDVLVLQCLQANSG
ncbi:hypothetical protein EG68_03355 [Paragonimus skrjabini miyazakii]|uniref:Kinesin-like protein n=1 Tax=Paragonimus skrjabini miyazakii TaxID=59628 RepID=A0A8S9Z1T1_9TREM|nr:hypothetical protein EG68_03355 [Paragonimus skrjabini miyazakii]